MAFVAGKDGRLTVGATNMPCTDIEANLYGQAVETTNSESGGFETFIGGIAGGDISFTVNYDSPAGYLNMVLPNASYTMEFLPLKTATTAKWSGSVFVESARIIQRTKSNVPQQIRVTGKANGAYTYANL